MEVVRHLGLPEEPPEFPVDFPVPEDLPEGRFAVLAPCSKWGSKNWPVEHFAEVGRHLRDDHDLDVLVVGAPADAPVGDTLVAAIGDRAFNRCGATNLPGLGGTLSQAAILVCNDSGPMHIAAACGTRTVALFGPTCPLRTGPWGNHAVTLRPDRFDDDPTEVLPFRHDDPSVISEIRADQVTSACDLLLGT